MKFEKLEKEYQQAILTWIFEDLSYEARDLLYNKDFQQYILNNNYSVNLWKKALKSNDFEDVHEFVGDILYQYEKKHAFCK